MSEEFPGRAALFLGTQAALLGTTERHMGVSACGFGVHVQDADVDAFYQQNRPQFEQGESVHVSHILIAAPQASDAAQKQEAKSKAQKLLKQLKGGADFAQLAKEMSEDSPTASRGGDIGLIAAGEIVPDVDKVIQGMKAGEVAGPVRSPFGYHILKVFEVVPGSRKELKEVADTEMWRAGAVVRSLRPERAAKSKG